MTIACAAVSGLLAAGCSVAPWLVRHEAPASPPPTQEETVAYVADRHVWLMPLGGGEPRRLVRGDAPVLSPDGRWVAVLRWARRASKLVVVDATSGRIVLRRDGGDGVAWSPDGRRLAVAAGHRLLVIDVSAGTQRTYSVAPQGGWFGDPSWSPDGRAIAGMTSVGDSDAWDVVVVRLADGAVVPVTDDGLGLIPRWGPAGIAYVHDQELTLVREPGADAVAIPVPPAEVSHATWLPVAWSADGGRLLLTTGCAHGCQEAAVFDLPHRRLTHLGVGSPAAISRDGERVLLQQDCDSGLVMAEPSFPLAVVEVDTLMRSTLIPATACGASWSP